MTRPRHPGVPPTAGVPRPVGAALERVVRALDVPGTAPLRALPDAWRAVVGSHIADRTMGLALRGDRVEVLVDDPAAAGALRWDASRLAIELERVLEVPVAHVDIRARSARGATGGDPNPA